jgi:hypothetical protein
LERPLFLEGYGLYMQILRLMPGRCVEEVEEGFLDPDLDCLRSADDAKYGVDCG